MNVAHEKLNGLDRERVLAAVRPVLAAHGVDAVELVWRTDRSGWLLELTLEFPHTRIPGEGITVELCTDVSRDLSAALDVADVIPHRYRLEVGSPGLERALYSANDYTRFSGQVARLKLKQALEGQFVVRGTLEGLDSEGHVLIRPEEASEAVSIPLDQIEQARLVFEMGGGARRPGSSGRAPGSKNKSGARTQR